MQVQKIVFFNGSKNWMKNPQILQQNYSKPDSGLTDDTVTFGASTPLKPNQVLPATEKLIQRAIRQTKIEKNKIITALNKTWESYTMGKVSNIYIGHKELPLDQRQVESLHQSIQLTGNAPGHEKIYFFEKEPNRYVLHIEPINSTKKFDGHTTYDIDYRTNKEGMITEFDPEMGMSEETTDTVKIKQLNERVQYCLKFLFPQKKQVVTPK